MAAASVTDVLGFIEHYVVPASAGAPFPTPHFPPTVAPTSIGSSLIWIYNTVEPWTRWIADVAAYAVGWIPYVGWLSGQIPIFYNFGERIARSITYNVAYWLDGNISFVQGLGNVGVDTINAFIQLGIDQWNFWLWPLPPLPPIFPSALAASTAELTATADLTSTDGTQGNEKHSVIADAESTEAPPDEVVQDLEVKAPKKVKEPKETEATTEVAVEGEVAGSQDEATTATTKTPKRVKKADDGHPAKAATESSTSNEPAGDKHDNDGEKKDDTGAKDKKDEKK